MKKPNLSSNNWELDETGMYVKIGDYTVGCVGPNYYDDGLDFNDAKTISAVPNMIDALIEAEDVISHIYDSGTEGAFLLRSTLDQIREALEKAGCHK